jgi:pyruvate/2-oxoglutarate dehydrogenase complex dihydrolipoamide acyltransferase (E2) component
MATDVVLPQWGMGMQEGTVVAWLKAEGDDVAVDEPIVEIETEKVTNTITAPVAGTLARIAVPEGETAQIYELLAVITAPGETLTAAAPAAAAPAESAVASAAATVARDGGGPQAEPRARRVAADHGLDLATVAGTGPGGRITEADVWQALDGRRG